MACHFSTKLPISANWKRENKKNFHSTLLNYKKAAPTNECGAALVMIIDTTILSAALVDERQHDDVGAVVLAKQCFGDELLNVGRSDGLKRLEVRSDKIIAPKDVADDVAHPITIALLTVGIGLLHVFFGLVDFFGFHTRCGNVVNGFLHQNQG